MHQIAKLHYDVRIIHFSLCTLLFVHNQQCILIYTAKLLLLFFSYYTLRNHNFTYSFTLKIVFNCLLHFLRNII